MIVFSFKFSCHIEGTCFAMFLIFFFTSETIMTLVLWYRHLSKQTPLWDRKLCFLCEKM